MGFDNPGTESVAMKNFSGFVYFSVQVMGFFNGHKIEWFKIKAFVIECYLYIQVMSHSKLSKHYGNRLDFVWGCYLIKNEKKLLKALNRLGLYLSQVVWYVNELDQYY